MAELTGKGWTEQQKAHARYKGASSRGDGYNGDCCPIVTAAKARKLNLAKRLTWRWIKIQSGVLVV